MRASLNILHDLRSQPQSSHERHAVRRHAFAECQTGRRYKGGNEGLEVCDRSQQGEEIDVVTYGKGAIATVRNARRLVAHWSPSLLYTARG